MSILATPYAVERAKLTEDTLAATWPSPEAGFLDYLNITTCIPTMQRPAVLDRLDETPMLASAGYQYANPHFVRPAGYDDLWAPAVSTTSTTTSIPHRPRKLLLSPP